MWLNDSCKRIRRTLATTPGFRGFSLFSDNVGKVLVRSVYWFDLLSFVQIVTPSHNTGIVNKGQYLQMTITIVSENRIASSHMRFSHHIRQILNIQFCL